MLLEIHGQLQILFSPFLPEQEYAAAQLLYTVYTLLPDIRG